MAHYTLLLSCFRPDSTHKSPSVVDNQSRLGGFPLAIWGPRALHAPSLLPSSLSLPLRRPSCANHVCRTMVVSGNAILLFLATIHSCLIIWAYSMCHSIAMWWLFPPKWCAIFSRYGAIDASSSCISFTELLIWVTSTEISFILHSRFGEVCSCCS